MKMPLSEVIDRMSIIKLKIERIGEPHLRSEFGAYEEAIEDYKKTGVDVKDEWLEELHLINGKIWDLESDIRKGKEGELGLEEVGRRAIMIRELNKKRITLKNEIADLTGIGFKDVKMNHVSE